MTSKQLRVNGTLVDLTQSEASTEGASTLVQRRPRPTVLSQNDLQGLALNVNSRSAFVYKPTPSHYNPAHQFLPGTSRLAALPDELVAQMFMEWLDKFPRPGERQTLYVRVLQRLEQRVAHPELEPELTDSRPDPETTSLFLRMLNELEISDQESPNYTDQELGLT